MEKLNNFVLLSQQNKHDYCYPQVVIFSPMQVQWNVSIIHTIVELLVIFSPRQVHLNVPFVYRRIVHTTFFHKKIQTHVGGRK